jgi:hypothetical protein
MIRGELALWRAAIIQALNDATNKGLSREERMEARAWFRKKSLDFELVCHLAGLDSEAVRRQFLRRKKRNQKGKNDREKGAKRK